MRIINLKEFLTLKSGTLFCKYTQQNFGFLQKKVCNPQDNWIPDFVTTEMTGEIECVGSSDMYDKLVMYEKTGESFKFDLECSCRDG